MAGVDLPPTKSPHPHSRYARMYLPRKRERGRAEGLVGGDDQQSSLPSIRYGTLDSHRMLRDSLSRLRGRVGVGAFYDV
jgi:hypothetical protein